jgi:hypothetical protein
MNAPNAPLSEGWTRVSTPFGRYEFQFQGRTPAVRGGKYEAATDYTFLLLDSEGYLFRIPVRVAAEPETQLKQGVDYSAVIRAAAAQLRAGLQKHQPRQNAPYEELDKVFSIGACGPRLG